MKWFKCCLCAVSKPESNFYRDKHKASGYKPRCKPCDKLSLNTENRKQYEKDYRLNNPEKRSAIVAKSIAKNIIHHRTVLAEYRKTKSFYELKRNHAATRRSRMANAFVEKVNFKELFNYSNKKCFYCNTELTFKTTEFDHYIPISKGGKHETSNIKCACITCNRRKGAKLPKGVGYQMV